MIGVIEEICGVVEAKIADEIAADKENIALLTKTARHHEATLKKVNECLVLLQDTLNSLTVQLVGGDGGGGGCGRGCDRGGDNRNTVALAIVASAAVAAAVAKTAGAEVGGGCGGSNKTAGELDTGGWTFVIDNYPREAD